MSATRAEIDAQRAIAAKAWEEGARWRRFSFDRKDVAEMKRCAAQWAAEQHPYPTVTRPRVVEADGHLCLRIDDAVEIQGGPNIQYRADRWSITAVKSIARLLTNDELDEVRRGPCGPTESVEAE